MLAARVDKSRRSSEVGQSNTREWRRFVISGPSKPSVEVADKPMPSVPNRWRRAYHFSKVCWKRRAFRGEHPAFTESKRFVRRQSTIARMSSSVMMRSSSPSTLTSEPA